MSEYIKYKPIEIQADDPSLQKLTDLVTKANNIIEALETLERPISEGGKKLIQDTNSKIELINSAHSSSTTNYNMRNNIAAATYEIENFYQKLKESAIDGFLQNKDIVSFFSSKRSLNAASKNLQEQKEVIEGYAKRLKDSTEEASRHIEQATTGLIASKIADRITDLNKQPRTKRKCLLEKIDEEDESKYQESVFYWFKKRQWSLRDLGIFTVLVIVISLATYKIELPQDVLFNLLAVKAVVLVLLYSRYYFAQKNYRIYASLLARYNHMLVNAKMLNGYMEVENKDPELYKNLVDKVTDLLTSSIEDHHFKNPHDNDSPSSVVKNFINGTEK